MTLQPSAIGVFDSGVGGLSVLPHLRAQLPHENLLYFADQAHVPYGTRTAVEICTFTEQICALLIEQNCRLIVIACNTATAAALAHLRQTFPNIPIVGMEPAVKPAVHNTRTGKIGVLATVRTFASDRYADLVARFAQGITVLEDPCRGLVPLIEAGLVDDPQTEALLTEVLNPMLAQSVDTVVLGCTHYPFVLPLITRLVGKDVAIIDPAPAVARQAQRLLEQNGLATPSTAHGTVHLLTSGELSPLLALAQQWLDFPFTAATAVWQGDVLRLA